MASVKEVLAALDAFAPVTTKMDFDNVGLLAGRGCAEVTKVLLALDITEEVIGEAAAFGAQLIVSHHPVFFSMQSVTDGDTVGRRVLGLLENRIAAICMHTNLDAADGGVNDALAAAVGIREPQLLSIDGTRPDGVDYGIGRWGLLERVTPFEAFLAQVKQALGTRGLRYWSAGRPARRVAVVGGSGGSDLGRAAELGCDTLITADVKYDVFLEARAVGMNLIDGDHYCTENLVIPVLRDVLLRAYPELEVRTSRLHDQTVHFY